MRLLCQALKKLKDSEAAARPPGPADAGLSKTSRVWEGVAA